MRLPNTRRPWRAAVAAGVGLLAALSLGCGGTPTGTVSGSVSVGGQPVKNGLITFQPDAGGSPQSAAIQDGKYTTGPISAGPCKVSIINRGANPAEGSAGAAAGGLGAGLGPGDSRPPPKPQGGAAQGKDTVPQKYADPTSSGLTFDVKPGENTKDFPL